ncbi:MAG: AAA family ATPase [Bacillota bacterium]|nr:AAA family ATPase [Bacillota bacterium]
MRPRYLEIEGLQSFKDMQRIDFDTLGETGLFGIFGATGSGKSTVLDAITLALYGNVQRASRGTQGIINTELEDARVLFRFDLLKDGARRTYIVERVYRRKKDSDVSVENKLSRLIRVSGEDEYQVLADKLNDVNSKVEELIGLKSDDFTRSVVLPQNRFQEFLLLEKSKKREMLERIFYLEEYGRELTDKVGRKLNEVREKLAGIQGAMSALGDVSEKTLEQAERNMKDALENKERILRELKEFEARYEQAREVWDLTRELDGLTADEKEHMQRIGEINEKKAILDNYARARELADIIVKYRDAKEMLDKTISDLQALDARLPVIQGELDGAREAYGLLMERVERDRPRLIERKSKLRNALEMQEEIKGLDLQRSRLLDRYNTLKRQGEEKDKEIEGVKSELRNLEDALIKNRQLTDNIKISPEYRREVQAGAKLEDEIRGLEEEKMGIQERYDGLAGRIKTMAQELEGLTLHRNKTQEEISIAEAEIDGMEAAKPGERHLILNELSRIGELKLTVEALKAKKADLEALGSRLEVLGTETGVLKKSYSDWTERAGLLNAKLQDINVLIDGNRRELEKSTAQILAKSLKENEPCPVCGSTHHPKPAVFAGEGEREDIERRLEILLDEQKQTEARYREAESKCLVINEQIKSYDKQAAQIRDDMKHRETEYASLVEKLPQSMRAFEITRVEEELNNRATINEEALKKLDQLEEELAEKRKTVQYKKDELSQYIIKERTKAAELDMSRASLQELEKDLEEIVLKIADRNDWLKDFVQKTGIRSAVSELGRIEEKDRELEELRKKAEEFQESIKTVRGRLDGLNDSRRELSEGLAAVETEGRSLKEQRVKLEKKIRDVVGDGDPDAALKQTEDELTTLSLQEKELSSAVKDWEERYNAAKSQKHTLANQQRIYRESYEREKERLEKGLRDKGFERLEQAERALITQEEYSILKADVEEFDRKLRSIAAQKEMVAKKLGDRSITEREWDIIREAYAVKQKERDDGISRYEGVRAEYRRVKDSYRTWVELEKENKSYSGKCDMLEQIQKLLRGNSFIEFISEERLRYIAKEASETLGVLTRFRYSLELDPEQGFVIRDFLNGGVHRAVSSLSGGETFLTSLSLALALSKQIQLKGQSPLEFFFLDEGFGTLDGELLDLVVDALERLSSRERVIGLISHVPELKNRIPRRLIVESPTPGGSGSRVRIEKA